MIINANSNATIFRKNDGGSQTLLEGTISFENQRKLFWLYLEQ